MEPQTSPVLFLNRPKDFIVPVFVVASVCVLGVLVHGCDRYAYLLCFLNGYFLANTFIEFLEWFRNPVKLPVTKLLLHFVPGDLPCFVVTSILTMTCRHEAYLSAFILAFLSILVYRGVTELHPVEIRTLRERWKLAPGYFSAAAYYYNYLKLFIPFVFVDRVKEFQSRHDVEVTNKLFVLVPKSCKRKRYIDDTEQIERSRELPTFKLNIAGVVDRVYEITVYRVSENLDFADGYRCCVEYAQPLSELWDMHASGKITKNDMRQELILFIQTLYQLLCDENDSYKVCELLCYDDDETDVAEILFRACKS